MTPSGDLVRNVPIIINKEKPLYPLVTKESIVYLEGDYLVIKKPNGSLMVYKELLISDFQKLTGCMLYASG